MLYCPAADVIAGEGGTAGVGGTLRATATDNGCADTGSDTAGTVGSVPTGFAGNPLVGVVGAVSPVRRRRRRLELARCNSEYSSGGKSSGATSTVSVTAGSGLLCEQHPEQGLMEV